MAGKGASLRAVPVSPQPTGEEDPLSYLPQPQPASPAPAGLGNGDDLGFDLPDEKPAIENTYRNVSQMDPTRAAEVMHYAGRLNEPEAFIDKNLDHVKAADSTPSPSFFTELEQQYPGSTKFLSDPRKMAVTHDDLPNVTQHEAAVKQASSYLEDFQAGAESSTAGLIYRQKLPDLTLPENAGIIESFVHAAGAVAGDFPFMLAGGAAGTAAGGPVGGAAAGFAAPAMIKKWLVEQYTNGDVKSYGDLFERLGVVAKEGIKQGAIGAVTGVVGQNLKVFNALGSPLTQKLTGTIPQLLAEDVAMTASGKAIEGQSPTSNPKDYVDGLLQIAAMHGIAKAFEMHGERVGHEQQTEKAANLKQFYTALGDTAEASKLRERMPDVHQEMIYNLTKDGPVENIYIPVEALDKYLEGKGIPPEAAAEELGITKMYQEAKQTGRDVQIPLADWVNRVVGTEHYKGLADDIKFSPDDLTVRQAHERSAEIDQQMKDAAAKAEAGEPLDGQIPSGKITQTIQEQLKAAGLTAQEASVNPQIHEAFFKTLGEKLNVDPHELALKFPLEIQRVKEVSGEDGLNQPARSVTFPVKQSKEGIFSIDAGEGLDAAARMVDGKMHIDGLNFDKKYAGVGQDMIRSLEKTAVAGGAFSMEANAKTPRERAAYEAQGFEVQSESKDGALMFKDLSKEKVFNQSDRSFQTSVAMPDAVKFTEADEPVKSIAEVRENANEKFKGKTFTNVHTGWAVEVNNLGKASGTLASEGNRLAMTHLDRLIESAIFARTEQDKAGGNNDIHVLYAPMRSATKDYVVKIVVRESEGKKFYDKFAIEKESPATEVAPDQTGNQVAGEESANKSRPSAIPIEQFMRDVKGIQASDPYFQPGEGSPRGQIRFGGDRKFNIDLLPKADKSTFLHETGHYFLEVLGDVANQEAAPEHITRDYQTLLDWFGVKSRDEIKTEHHEKFARGFEAYLREGKAPSEALRAAFDKFKTWLLGIYHQLKDLNVELTPEVRGVMDRMLASEKEIENAKKFVAYDGHDIPGITPEIQKRISSLQEKARSIAEASLLKEQMKELDAKHEKFLGEQHALATENATKEVKALPLYSAIESLKEYPGAKKDQAAFAEKFLKGKLKPKDEAHMEMLAEINYGGPELRSFADGEDLAHQIIAAAKSDSFNKEVQSRVALAMAPHADLRDTAKIKEEAITAIHGEKMTELLALEHQALTDLVHEASIRQEVSKRKRAEALIDARAAKAQAKTLLADKPIKDATKASIYITAERNAAIKVSKALAKEDYAAAVEAKRQQMLSHALVAEAMRNKTESEKSLKFLASFDKRGRDLEKMPYGFIRQIDQLLERHELSDPKPYDQKTMESIASDMAQKGEPPGDIANATGLAQDGNGKWAPEKLNDFVARVNDNYYSLSLADSLLSDAQKNYETLTMGELRALKEGVQAVSEIGKKYNHFLGEYHKVDIKTAAKEFRTSLEKNIGTPYAEGFEIGSKNKSALGDKIDTFLNLPDSMIPDLVNILTLTHYLDGAKEDGPAKEFIYRPLKMAEDRKLARYEGMTEKVNKLLSDHFTPKELSDYKNKREFFESVGRHLTREQILSMGLNWGNEGNRDRIRRGYNLNDGQVGEILNRLTKNEWDFIQKTWDHLETYWPDIVKLEMKVRGVEPKGVEATMVETPHGNYKGGYFPIAYDFEKSADAYKNAEQKNALYKQFSATAAHTDTGHTQERVTTVARPVSLSLSTLFNHLENVVHDLEYRSAVIDVSRFLKEPDVKASLENAIGIKGSKAIGEWLKAAASDQGEHLNMADKALRWFRFNGTFATLGYRVVTFPIDVVGNTMNGVWEIGPARMASAIKEFAMNAGDTKELVQSKSERMRFRATLRDRDISEMAKKWQGKDSALKQYGFLVQSIADEAVSIPLWNEVYKRALAEHGEEKAINIADEAVTRTVGSGSMLDQVGAQRGTETKKIFSMYYSYMSMMFNRCWLDGKMAGLEYKEGNTGQALAIIAKATFFAWVMQSANENFWKELFRNKKQDDKGAEMQRVVGRTLAQPFSYVWMVRDIAAPVIEKALGQKNANYQMSPLASAADTILTTAGQGANLAFTHNHANERFAENSAKSAAYLLGYPQTLNTYAFNFLDWTQNNGEATWRDLITRRTKK